MISKIGRVSTLATGGGGEAIGSLGALTRSARLFFTRFAGVSSVLLMFAAFVDFAAATFFAAGLAAGCSADFAGAFLATFAAGFAAGFAVGLALTFLVTFFATFLAVGSDASLRALDVEDAGFFGGMRTIHQ